MRRRRILMTLLAGGDTTAPSVTDFAATSPSGATVPITTFTASEAGVSWLITENSTPPAAGAAGWSSGSAPTTFAVSGGAGDYTLYPWVKDAAGNVSAVYGSPASVQVGLLWDEFTTDVGSVTSPRTCEPGPGTLTLGASLPPITSIASGELYINGQPTNGTNVVRGTALLTRTAGRCFHIKLTNRAGTNSSRIGFGDGGSTMRVGMVNITNAILPYIGTDVSAQNIAADNSAVTDFYFIMTDNGGHIIADVGGSKKLLWTGRDGTSNAYPQIMAYAFSSLTLKSDNWQVYDLASPYNSDYGIVTNRVASPGANETIVGTADGIHEFTWTPQAAETETFMFRRTDDDNCFKLVCDQAAGTIKLYRRQTGSDTELNAGKTQTWSAGTPYRIVVVTDGTSIKTWVGFTGKHAATDAFNQSATGVKTSLGGSNLISWPLSMPPF